MPFTIAIRQWLLYLLIVNSGLTNKRIFAQGTFYHPCFSRFTIIRTFSHHCGVSHARLRGFLREAAFCTTCSLKLRLPLNFFF